MAVILKLPDSTIQLIAAGEVITRPVNIVKELLENSLDAGSTNIRVTIMQGGMKLIEIIDNGHGIANSNAAMLCRRYTTSKLSTADDLTRLSTFGFRGEALASISEMADVEVRTFCMSADNMGWVANYKRGELVEPPCDKYLQHAGTHLRITNLFASVPSRRHAMKSNFIDEKKLIIEMITRYAIHHRDRVTISLKDGNNDLVCLLAPMKIGPCIGMFHGVEMENNLMEFPITSDTYFKLNAQITLSYKKFSGNNGTFTFILFVNDRLVECQDLKKELEVLLNEYLSMKMYNLLTIANLHVPPCDVDVNMHPSKETVTLHYFVEIVQLLVSRVREELKLKLNVNNIAPSTPIIEKTISQLISQQFGKNIKHTSSYKHSDTPDYGKDYDHNYSQDINHKRLKTLAPGSATPKRCYDLVHNDYSQKTLDQLGNSRKRYSEEIKPWPGIDSMGRNTKKVILKSPSPSSETVVYKLDNDDVQEIAPKVLPPLHKRRELKLRSIYELRKLVAKDKAIESTEVIKHSTFVGVYDHDKALIQHETKLYSLNLKSYLEEQFYQFYLFDIGNFPPIEILPPGNKIRFIIETTLSDIREHDQATYRKLRFQTVDGILGKLLTHASMFEDYFSLKVTQTEIVTIPCILPDEVPNLNFLGRFLINLACEVDYTDETECLRRIGQLFANFYAEPPANMRDESVRRTYHNLVQTKLYEAIKQYLIIPDRLLTKENTCQISDTKDLYKVFERC